MHTSPCRLSLWALSQTVNTMIIWIESWTSSRSKPMRTGLYWRANAWTNSHSATTLIANITSTVIVIGYHGVAVSGPRHRSKKTSAVLGTRTIYLRKKNKCSMLESDDSISSAYEEVAVRWERERMIFLACEATGNCWYAVVNSRQNAGSNLYHEFEKNRPRWHRRRTTSIPAYSPASSFQHDWSFYADNSEHTTNTNDDDEDDESMNEMEILAAVNAERNIIGTAYRASLDDISVRLSSPTTEAPEQQYTLSPDGPTNTPAIAPMEPTPTNSQANSGSNTPAVATGAATGNNQRQQQQHQKKRRWWPLNYLFRRTPNSSTLTTPSPTSQGSLSSTTTQSASSSPSNNIKSIKTNGPLGDLLDPEQQEKIVDQLAVADPLVSEGTTTIPDNNEAIKIASLDRIWIFRLSEHPDSLWIVFDYANQHKLTQYTHQIYHNPGADQGVEFFDSHVHNGRLPVLVLPSRQCGYYPTNFTGEHIASLHVICIPNSSNLQFVYRQQHS